MSDPFFVGPILGIETSCDETSAAVTDGARILSNVVSSQVDLHAKWGGVVPEAAARAHVESILPVVEEALSEAGCLLPEIRAIAVTNRPGLVGALSVGVSAAKALSLVLNIPLIGVHHLEGHLCSLLAGSPNLPYPRVCLIVSGGHTEIVRVGAARSYEIVGQTIDDAAGEAFDKGARLLGLGYPGGRAIQDTARGGNPYRYPLPKGLNGDTHDFSFSGLKTAVLRLVEKEGPDLNIADAAASLQHAIVEVLVERTMAALAPGDLAVGLVGGVAANLSLRSRLEDECRRSGIRFATPAIALCTDNAAMIALAGSGRLAAGQRDDFELDCLPNAPLPGLVHK